MKTNLSKLFALLAALMLVLAACGGETVDEQVPDATAPDEPVAAPAEDMAFDLGGREVTVGVENAYLPFNYVLPGETEGQGWDYDAWRAICEVINCTPVFVEAGWPQVIDQVASGEIDTAADGISITDERAEIVDFSDPYMVVEQKFVVGLDDDRYADADALIASDAVIATQVGTTNYELAASLVDEGRIQAFDQFGFAIQALIAGDVDAVIIDDAAGLGYIGENADQIATLPGALQSDPLGFIYPLGSDLVEPVNYALEVIRENGTLEAIGRVFFSDTFTVTYDDLFPPEEDDAALPDLDGREVTVGVENAYLPFNYIPAGETEGQGWDYDAWRAICELLNCNPVFVEAGWPQVIDQVASGEFDTAADGISITEDRAEIVAFSDAYMVVQQKFIVLLGEDRYADADALIASDALIATQVGTTNYELAVSLVDESRVAAYDQFGLAIQALISGDVDAVIIDDAAGLGYVGENADSIATLDGALQSDPLGFIYPLDSDLVDAVNQALAVLKADGTLEELGRTYFTDAFTVTYDDIEG